MKTYKQFNHDMKEGLFNNPVTRLRVVYNKIASLKNFMRLDNIKKLKNNPNMIRWLIKHLLLHGTIAPYSLPAYAKDIYQSGKN